MSTRESTNTFLEIAGVITLVIATIWVAPLLSSDHITAHRIGYCLAGLSFGLVVISNIGHQDGLKATGLRVDNFLPATRILLLPTLLVLLVLLLVGSGFDSLRFNPRIFPFKPVRLLLPFFQQYLLQAFLNLRLQDVYGKSNRCQLLSVLIFSLIHLPNPVLMAGTMVAGAIWVRAFQIQPNLFALTLSHVLIGTTFAHSLPKWLLPNMKVGWAYFA